MRSLVLLTITLVAVDFMNVKSDVAADMANVARGKPAFQSSVSAGGVPSRAVDGDTSTNYNERSCTLTANGRNPWWAVDLQREYVVQAIRITNRGDCCAERLHYVSVYVSHYNPTHNKPSASNLCAQAKGPFLSGETRRIVCTNAVNGRYVIISLQGDAGILTLCEVEVYGVPADMENIARGKPVFQSSVWVEGVPSRAVDGITSTEYYINLSCTHTWKEADPWWAVDLRGEYHVQEIRITNRGDCCDDRLHGVSVYVTHYNPTDNKPGASELCAKLAFTSGEMRRVFCAKDLKGRYVLISLQGDNRILTLCEVEVYGVPADMENVARDKPAFQSSVSEEGVPSRAVDGITSTDYVSHNSCTNTMQEARPWWAVDLLSDYLVQEIRITNRGDCCAERLHDVSVYVSHHNPTVNNPGPSVLCAQLWGPFPSGETRRVFCPSDVTGRYVIISLPGDEEKLTLCEVQVYGVPVSFGECHRTCHGCMKTRYCVGAYAPCYNGTTEEPCDTSTMCFESCCPRDCSAIYYRRLNMGQKMAAHIGVYEVVSADREPHAVVCDMDEEAGWTVIQRREDAEIDFDRGWDEYRDGFGTLYGSFWLGNKFVHELSSAMPQVLRFDFHFSDDSHTYATYNQFYISDEAGWFSWHVGNSFNGTADDVIHEVLSDGMFFITGDRTEVAFPGPWWYGIGETRPPGANVNGVYGGDASAATSMYWKFPPAASGPTLTGIEIKMRPEVEQFCGIR